MRFKAQCFLVSFSTQSVVCVYAPRSKRHSVVSWFYLVCFQILGHELPRFYFASADLFDTNYAATIFLWKI